MVVVICLICKRKFKDKSPHLIGYKFCCREHWRQYLREKGSWNKGKKWKDMYNKDTLEKLQKRIRSTGKDHHLYGTKRPDLVLSNIMNNPMHSSERKQEIQDIINKNSTGDAIIKLLKTMNQHKLYAYQRKAYERYGKKCYICFQTEGQIDVHHKDKNHKNNKIENLQVLCASCHGKLHKPKSIKRKKSNN